MTPAKSLMDVEPAGVRKKMKPADFARNGNRDDSVGGAVEVGVEVRGRIAFVLEAMREVRAELGL